MSTGPSVGSWTHCLRVLFQPLIENKVTALRDGKKYLERQNQENQHKEQLAGLSELLKNTEE